VIFWVLRRRGVDILSRAIFGVLTKSISRGASVTGDSNLKLLYIKMRFFTEAGMTVIFVYIQKRANERLITCLLETLKLVEYQINDPNGNFKQTQPK
jgi:hypothetical protein